MTTRSPNENWHNTLSDDDIADNINETSENINTHLSFGSKLFGSAKDKAPHDTVAFNDSCSLAIRSGSDKWSRVFTSETQHTVSLNCRAGGNCPDTEIFDTRSISWGRSKGGFKSYLVNTLFKFGENDEGFEYFDKHAANVVMKLSYRRAGFRAFVIGTRGILALLSLIFLVVWGHLTNKYYHRAAPEGGIYANAKRCCSRAEFWHTWLPQRRWVFWMGVSMFWWQNPIFVFTELAGESGAVASVITESISSVSWAMVFAMWILMVDGLGQPDPYRREFSSKFYIPKILFVVLYCIVTISMHILRQPELVHDSSNRSVFGGQQSNDTLLRVTLGMVITYIVLLLAWVFWFFHSLMKTRKVLLKLPYARTRFQQLTFRFLVWQTSVVVIFTIVINAIPFLRWCVMLLRSSGSDSSSNSDSQSNAARLSSLLQNVSEGFQPIGAYLLVSVYSYFLLYCYLPPKSSRIPTTVMERLEHGITNFLGVVTGSGTDSNTRPFSFEDGCWLFDFAWAAYFDPPPSIRVDADPANALSVDEESGLSPTDSSAGDLDPVPHGFHIEGFIYSKATDTVAIVFRRNWRVVLAFRGTVSYKNVVTDVKFARKAAEFSTANSNNLPANIPGVRQVLPLIHQGFWDAYASIKDPLHNVLRSALANAGEDAKLYCTGHSLGGALATIAAYDCRTMVLDICAQHRAFGIDRGQSNLMGNIRSFFEEVSGSFRRKFSSLTTPSRSHQDFGETSLSGGLSSQLVHNDSLGKSNHWYESTGTTPMEKSSGEVMEERRDQLDTAEAGANELEKSHNRRLSEIIQTLPQDSSDCGLGIVPEENNSNSAANLLSNTNNRREPTDDSQEEGRVIVYTFGSPRVGNRAFASQVSSFLCDVMLLTEVLNCALNAV